MSTTTSYDLAVHLSATHRSRKLARIVRRHGLSHRTFKAAIAAARGIVEAAGTEVEGINVSRVKAEHIRWVRPR